MTPPFTRDDHDKALIIHMSDTHISALGVNPARPNPHYNARVAVDIACERITQSGLRPDLICVTGDICDAEIGERAREAYHYVRERIGALGRCLACPVVFAMGNHDERAVFRSELLSAEKDDKCGLQMTLRTEKPSDSVDYMMMVPTVEGSLRVIVLDTSVPGQDTGTVSEEQCAWDACIAVAAYRCGNCAYHAPSPVGAVARTGEVMANGSVGGGASVRSNSRQ